LAKRETKKREQNEAYMENYKQQVQRLYWLSKFNVRQFLGTRQDGDPRVDYLAGLEGFKNLANSQLSSIIGILTMMLGDKKQEFLKVMEEELANQIKAMEEDIGVVGWTDNGEPQFDLAVLRERTRGWPA